MKKIKILLAEDEVSIRKIIKKYLELEGYTVLEADDGTKALEIFTCEEISLCIFDIMMPNLDGYELTKKIRTLSEVPIIMLTAKGLEDDKIKGFNSGTDDYMTKPFSSKELVLRVKALLKRAGKNTDEILEIGYLKIDVPAMKVFVLNEKIELTKKDFDLLYYLASNAGVALSREQIIEEVWGYDFEGDDRTVDTAIKRLRKKLGTFGENIVTIRGYGYRLDIDEITKN